MSDNKKQYESLRPEHQLGDAPIQADYHESMVVVMRAIDEVFNGDLKAPHKTTGIVMLVFPFGEGGRCNFMSNGVSREDIVTLMKEMIARFEGQAEMKGKA